MIHSRVTRARAPAQARTHARTHPARTRTRTRTHRYTHRYTHPLPHAPPPPERSRAHTLIYVSGRPRCAGRCSATLADMHIRTIFRTFVILSAGCPFVHTFDTRCSVLYDSRWNQAQRSRDTATRLPPQCLFIFQGYETIKTYVNVHNLIPINDHKREMFCSSVSYKFKRLKSSLKAKYTITASSLSPLPIPKVRLGASELWVPEIGFSASSWGDPREGYGYEYTDLMLEQVGRLPV